MPKHVKSNLMLYLHGNTADNVSSVTEAYSVMFAKYLHFSICACSKKAIM